VNGLDGKENVHAVAAGFGDDDVFAEVGILAVHDGLEVFAVGTALPGKVLAAGVLPGAQLAAGVENDDGPDLWIGLEGVDEALLSQARIVGKGSLHDALARKGAAHGGRFVRIQLQAALRGAQGLFHGLLLRVEGEIIGGPRDVQQDAGDAEDHDERDGKDEQRADAFDAGHGQKPPNKMCDGFYPCAIRSCQGSCLLAVAGE